MIPFRRISAFLIAAWLTGSLFMDATAITNFRTVDRFLANPGVQAEALIQDLGQAKTRVLLRRAAGEANIHLFEGWEWTQLGVGLLLLGILVFAGRPLKFQILLCVLMLTIILASRFLLTPAIAGLGRQIEFLAADPSLPARRTFGMYHGVSSSLELIKLALGFVLAGTILFSSKRSESKLLAQADELIEATMHARKPR